MNSVFVSINLGKDKQFKGDLVSEMLIDEAEINRELSEAPAVYTWWASMEVFAKDAMLAYEGVASEKLRRPPKEDKIPSETKIQSLLLLDDDYIGLKKQHGLMRVAKEASAARKEMLISLAANLREQRDSSLKVMKNKVEDVLNESRKKRREV